MIFAIASLAPAYDLTVFVYRIWITIIAAEGSEIDHTAFLGPEENTLFPIVTTGFTGNVAFRPCLATGLVFTCW